MTWWWLLAGCRTIEEDAFTAPLRDAWLEKVNTRAFTVLGGPWGGEADLVLEGRDRSETRVPVRLRGGTIGLGVEVVFYAGGKARMTLPDTEVTGNDVFGHYSGSAANFTVLAGVEAHHLKNDAGIEIDAPSIDVGVALMFGAEWMSIEARETVIPDPTTDETP